MTENTPDKEWFVRARYGMFIHYGLYSQLGRGEWVMNRERLSRADVRALASLGECGDVCAEHPSSKEDRRHQDVTVVSS